MKYCHKHRSDSQKAHCYLSNHFQLDCKKKGGGRKKKKQGTVEHSANRKDKTL